MSDKRGRDETILASLAYIAVMEAPFTSVMSCLKMNSRFYQKNKIMKIML